ncbi:MAG: hypothetical protein R6V67_11660 [Spirochaetia bacterium]
MRPKQETHTAGTPQKNEASFSVGAAIFFVSAAILLLQLFLMRSFSVTRYHHFSYLVISTALLGFGVGGTFLSLFYEKLKKRFELWSHIFLFLFTISIPLSYSATRLLPIDIQYLLYSFSQALLFILYNFLIFIPFFLGALIISFFLTHYSRRIPILYGVNLFASGLGGVGALGLMFLFPAERLPLLVSIAALAALSCRLPTFIKTTGLSKVSIGSLLLAAAVTAAALIAPVPGEIDPYKTLSRLRDLEAQGDAESIATRHTPRMRLDIFDAPSLRRTLFVSPSSGKAPPPQLAILADGDLTGTIFKTNSIEETEVMRLTPQSLPYRLLSDKETSSDSGPSTLLLGETGGSNIWLARQYKAEKITMIQENESLLQLMRGPLSGEIGDILRSPGTNTVEKFPNLFLEQANDSFDLIQFASAEGMPAGTGGLNSLHENYLLTVEAVSRAIELLNKDGYIAITRGIQSPPRDNIKIFALFTEALRRSGVEEPSRHILQARNYLAVTTLIRKSPVTEETVSRFLQNCGKLEMDTDYYPGIVPGETEQINRIQGPEGENYSYYAYAAQKLLSDNPREVREFYREWAYDVRPPTNESPYFHNFFKWASIGSFVEAYGGSFFRQMELGYLILVFTLAEITLIAFVLILLPLFVHRNKPTLGKPHGRSRIPVFLHFAGIGLGFMCIEMVFIQKLSNFLGDPIYSASAVITSILVFAGIGSSLQKQIPLQAVTRIRIAASLVILYAAGAIWSLDPLLDMWLAYETSLRYLLSILILLPVSFFMGWLLPSGMERIEPSESGLIPWAWGINGFTSVAASPLAILLSISLGFSGVLTAAALCYAVTGLATFIPKNSL